MVETAKENRLELRTLLTEPAVGGKSLAGLDRDTDTLIRAARSNLIELMVAVNRL